MLQKFFCYFGLHKARLANVAGMFKLLFLVENYFILIEISLKFVSNGPNNIEPAFVQMMAWCEPGDIPLYDLMMA